MVKTRDVVRTVNAELHDRAVRHAVFLRRYSNGEARRMAAMVDVTARGIAERVVIEMTRGLRDRSATATRIFKSEQYKTMLSRIDSLVQDMTAKGYTQSRDSLYALGKLEARWQREVMNQVLSPVGLGAKAPAAEMIRAAVTSRPMEGRILRNWWRDLGASAQKAVTRQINNGIAGGASIQQIAKGVSDALGTTRNQAHAIARTAVNHVSAHAREETYLANEDIISGVQYVATLDDRTTMTCAALDGQIFAINDGPRPPMHFNCRSTTVPVLKSAKELGLKDIPLSARASMDGRATGEDTYGTWLHRQPHAVQEDVLGKERAELFRTGQVEITRFVDSQYSPLNLQQLAKREGLSLEK